MKKCFANKQFAIIVIALIVVFTAISVSTIFATPSVAYASSNEIADDEIYYAGFVTARYETETFSYSTKTTESYFVNATFPNYYNTNNSLQNICAPVAGSNIIAYYARYFNDLIPGVTIGQERNGVFIYYPMRLSAAGKQAVIDELYQRMQTNVTGEGSTQSQYENGLASYVQSKGLAISYQSVLTNGSFDLSKAVAQLKNGNPISLSMIGFCFADVKDSGNSVTLNKRLYDGNHIAIAYGYEKVNYFNANGAITRSEIYLHIATGNENITGVYIVNKYGQLSHAKAVNIQ